MKRRGLLAAGAATALRPARAAPAVPLSWFCWQAERWLAAPEQEIARLPPNSTRLLLGLDGAQLHGAATAEGRQRLERLLAAAHAAQLRVELLLGDPHWITPPGLRRLRALLAVAAPLPFDGLNLDLERGQLPGLQRAAWQESTTATLRAVRSELAWPLALTTHYEDLADAPFLGELAGAGVTEVLPMVYVSFPHLVRERCQRVFAAHAASGAALRITVAQSIERALPRGESWHRFGRQGALRAWQQLGAELAADPAFAGIAVQSLEEFEGAG